MVLAAGKTIDIVRIRITDAAGRRSKVDAEGPDLRAALGAVARANGPGLLGLTVRDARETPSIRLDLLKRR